jgi:transposase
VSGTITIGIDAHKRTHTFGAVDELGRQLATRTLPATSDGHLDALTWAAQWPKRSWAVEDCRHLTRRLESDLLRSGETTVRVPTRLMADARRSSRERGKSDPIDALAVARAALREPGLPVARLDGPARRVRLLVDHREDLVAERTRIQCRLRWHLHEIAPELDVPLKGLRRQVVIDQIRRHLAPMRGTIIDILHELLDRCVSLTGRIDQLERDLRPLVTALAPSLLALRGCGVLSAAKIIGETAGASRFKSRSAFARFNGTAPIPVWSSNTGRVRLNRGGNRQINAALHRIAITQIRYEGPGRTYVTERMAAGKTKTEALRLLRRRLSDVVFRTLLADEAAAPAAEFARLPVAA